MVAFLRTCFHPTVEIGHDRKNERRFKHMAGNDSDLLKVKVKKIVKEGKEVEEEEIPNLKDVHKAIDKSGVKNIVRQRFPDAKPKVKKKRKRTGKIVR